MRGGLVPVCPSLAWFPAVGVPIARWRRYARVSICIHFSVRERGNLLENTPKCPDAAGTDDAPRHENVTLRICPEIGNRILIFHFWVPSGNVDADPGNRHSVLINNINIPIWTSDVIMLLQSEQQQYHREARRN